MLLRMMVVVPKSMSPVRRNPRLGRGLRQSHGASPPAVVAPTRVVGLKLRQLVLMREVLRLLQGREVRGLVLLRGVLGLVLLRGVQHAVLLCDVLGPVLLHGVHLLLLDVLRLLLSDVVVLLRVVRRSDVQYLVRLREVPRLLGLLLVPQQRRPVLLRVHLRFDGDHLLQRKRLRRLRFRRGRCRRGFARRRGP